MKKPKISYDVIPPALFTLSSETGCLISLELLIEAPLAGPLAPGILLKLLLQHCHYRCVPPWLTFFYLDFND